MHWCAGNFEIGVDFRSELRGGELSLSGGVSLPPPPIRCQAFRAESPKRCLF